MERGWPSRISVPAVVLFAGLFAFAGACVLPAGGCRPAGGAYFPTRWLPGFPGVYLKACQEDRECLRASDMGKDLYRCDVALGGSWGCAAT